MSVFLYHCDNETVHDLIDGILYTLPSDEVTEIPNDFHATRLIEHKAHIHGIVKVEMDKTKGGVTFKTEDAKVQARDFLKKCNNASILNYIRTQMEDRIKNGLPALPPHERLQRIIEDTKFDIFSYGVRPVGWVPKHLVAKAAESEDAANLRKQVESLTAQAASAENRAKLAEEALEAQMAANEEDTVKESVAADAPPPPVDAQKSTL